MWTQRSDDKIDYSDMPPLTDKFWNNAVRNPLYKPAKQITILREAMLRNISRKA